MPIRNSTGTTSATPANTEVPSRARNQVSIRLVADCAVIINILGQARRASVGAMGASSMACKRALAEGAEGVADRRLADMSVGRDGVR
ncbi:hypothetical protein D3C77_739050 [compost metagenome]